MPKTATKTTCNRASPYMTRSETNFPGLTHFHNLLEKVEKAADDVEKARQVENAATDAFKKIIQQAKDALEKIGGSSDEDNM
jgi:hypothetical protein